MTDLEKFVELYNGFGINVISEKTDEGYEVHLTENSYFDENDTVSEKFEGYPGFYTRIEFDENGKFKKQGFWE